MDTTEDTQQSGGPADGAPADETFGWTEAEAEAGASGGPAHAAREIIAQIRSAVETVADKAGPVARELAERAAPVAREVGARAAGLAALAGDKAGPIAQKAAGMTAEAGVKLAERSREMASELRRAGSTHEAAPVDSEDEADTPA